MSQCCSSKAKKKSSFSYFIHELKHHVFYSFVAVFASMAIIGSATGMSLLHSLFGSSCGHCCAGSGSFHALHLSHMFFAGATAVMSFRRHSKSIVGALLVGMLVPPIFCTFSDVIFPYLGGRLLDLDMALHVCFIDNPLLVLSVLLGGCLAGIVLSTSTASTKSGLLYYALGSHFLHEMVSALASLLYLTSFGGGAWMTMPISIFMLLSAAVVIPCLLSDLIIPVILAKLINANVKLCNRC